MTVERNTLGGIGVASANQTAILQKHFTDQAIAAMDVKAVRAAMDDLFGKPPTRSEAEEAAFERGYKAEMRRLSRLFKAAKTVKPPVFVFRPADDALLSQECVVGECDYCCGHKDCGTPTAERCECLCHYGAVQVGTMEDDA